MPARTKKKKPVACPTCGSTQMESAGAVSTFCRSCGRHFDLSDKPVAEAKAAPAAASVDPGVLVRLRVSLKLWFLRVFEAWILRYDPQIESLRRLIYRWRPPQTKRVRCPECAHVHDALYVALSTTCPQCNAHIDLADVLVEKRLTRTIQTRGALIIKKFGYLNGQLTICGHADIAGGAAGKLFCDNVVRIYTVGRLNCEIGARSVRIEKGADVVVAHPIRVHDLVVCGKLTARIYCNGTLRVLKRGHLKGEINARSIIIDKGATFQADLTTGPFDKTTPEIMGTPRERTSYSGVSPN